MEQVLYSNKLLDQFYTIQFESRKRNLLMQIALKRDTSKFVDKKDGTNGEGIVGPPSSCVQIALHLHKMFNVLQTYLCILHIPKSKCFK